MGEARRWHARQSEDPCVLLRLPLPIRPLHGDRERPRGPRFRHLRLLLRGLSRRLPVQPAGVRRLPFHLGLVFLAAVPGAGGDRGARSMADLCGVGRRDLFPAVYTAGHRPVLPKQGGRGAVHRVGPESLRGNRRHREAAGADHGQRRRRADGGHRARHSARPARSRSSSFSCRIDTASRART